VREGRQICYGDVAGGVAGAAGVCVMAGARATSKNI